MKRIDLHTHSTYSDGTLTPVELIDLAARKDLAAVAITDHDTVDGTAAALARGRQLGIEVLSGIEISARLGGTSMHILGYGVRHDHPELLNTLAGLQESRRRRNAAIFAKLNRLGIKADISEIRHMEGGQIGRPHIARLLIEKGVVRTMHEAFARYLKRNAPAHAGNIKIDAPEAIAVINRAGGLAMLAHPASIDQTFGRIPGLLRELAGHGLAGLEVYYPTHSTATTRRLKKLAEEFGLLASGGSDFHGDIRSDLSLGDSGGTTGIPYEIFQAIKQRLARQDVRMMAS